MALLFNLSDVRSTEFGVCIDQSSQERFVLVPVETNVQIALQEMAADTWMHLSSTENTPADYEPSEKYAPQEYVTSPLAGPLAGRLPSLHRATNIPIDTNVLNDASKISCYFARFVDSRGKRMTAIRRATQFKGLLKKNNRLLRLIANALQIVEDKTFKLDQDFDILIDGEQMHIWRPSGFEFIAKIQEAIRDAVPSNIASIQADINFVDFQSIENYSIRHTRAARHIASIRCQRETQNISPTLLKRACKNYGVDAKTANGKLIIGAGSEMTFLDILDRRMYESKLVENAPEKYRAGSRKLFSI